MGARLLLGHTVAVWAFFSKLPGPWEGISRRHGDMAFILCWGDGGEGGVFRALPHSQKATDGLSSWLAGAFPMPEC